MNHFGISTVDDAITQEDITPLENDITALQESSEFQDKQINDLIDVVRILYSIMVENVGVSEELKAKIDALI